MPVPPAPEPASPPVRDPGRYARQRQVTSPPEVSPWFTSIQASANLTLRHIVGSI